MARKTKAEAAATREALLDAAEEVFSQKALRARHWSKLLAMLALPEVPFIGTSKTRVTSSWRWYSGCACHFSR